MDKLSENIRRVGGELVAPKRPYGRRVLLPTEIELCEVLGITEDEYWKFVDTTAQYNGKRKEGYELIPDIRCDPVTAFLAAAGISWTQIAVAVVLTAIGYLLTPKPKPIKQGAAVRGADAIGSKRFAPQYEFNSIQELAVLGDTIPLVFANQIGFDTVETVIGGVRVSGQLLWSQLLSLGRAQQLKAITMFSLGEIDGRPDFAGYAIGDLLLSTYSKKKLDLFFKSSSLNEPNRITRDNFEDGGDKYPDTKVAGMPLPFNDVFSDSWSVGSIPTDDLNSVRDTHVFPFSGARNPTTQSIFGLYSPMPNANVVKLPYEFIFETRGMDEDAIKTMRVKVKKIATWWPTRAGFTGGDGTTVGTKMTYTIMRSIQPYDDTETTGTYPHGVEDVISMVRSLREETDTHLAIGDVYMAGDAIVSCVDVTDFKNGGSPPGTPWRQEEDGIEGIQRVYHFEVEEAGGQWLKADGSSYFSHPNLYEHEKIPTWNTDDQPEETGLPAGKTIVPIKVDNIYISTAQDKSDWSMKYGFAYRNPILQKVALGTISNSRSCSVTEIGLKSKVYNHVRGTNLNSIPTSEERNKIFKDRGSFQAGQMDLYLKRISFFKLQVRKIGTTESWTDLSNYKYNDHSGIFCVQGNTNEAQYNYIKITHPGFNSGKNSQFEYRFKPHPGNMVAVFGMKKNYNLLNANVTSAGLAEEENKKQQREKSFVCSTDYGNFVVTFAGRDDYYLDMPDVSNSEWIQTIERAAQTETGPVTEIDNNETGITGANTFFLAGPINPNPPDPEPSYNYDTTPGESHNETLISLNKGWGNGQWAWLLYENGVEKGIQTTPANTPIEDVKIHAYEKFLGNIPIITTTNQDGTVTNSSEKPASFAYTIEPTSAGSQDPFVDTNPINGEEVAYYKINRKIPTINLVIGDS